MWELPPTHAPYLATLHLNGYFTEAALAMVLHILMCLAVVRVSIRY